MSPTCPLANWIGMPRKTRFLSGISHTGCPKVVRPQDAKMPREKESQHLTEGMGGGTSYWDFQEKDRGHILHIYALFRAFLVFGRQLTNALKVDPKVVEVQCIFFLWVGVRGCILTPVAFNIFKS